MTITTKTTSSNDNNINNNNNDDNNAKHATLIMKNKRTSNYTMSLGNYWFISVAWPLTLFVSTVMHCNCLYVALKTCMHCFKLFHCTFLLLLHHTVIHVSPILELSFKNCKGVLILMRVTQHWACLPRIPVHACVESRYQLLFCTL